MNYLTTEESVKLSKQEILLQCVLGLQSCETKTDALHILLDVWEIAELRIKQKVK